MIKLFSGVVKNLSHSQHINGLKWADEKNNTLIIHLNEKDNHWYAEGYTENAGYINKQIPDDIMLTGLKEHEFETINRFLFDLTKIKI